MALPALLLTPAAKAIVATTATVTGIYLAKRWSDKRFEKDMALALSGQPTQDRRFQWAKRIAEREGRY